MCTIFRRVAGSQIYIQEESVTRLLFASGLHTDMMCCPRLVTNSAMSCWSCSHVPCQQSDLTSTRAVAAVQCNQVHVVLYVRHLQAQGEHAFLNWSYGHVCQLSYPIQAGHLLTTQICSVPLCAWMQL